MQVSIYDKSTFSHKHLFIIVPIISKPNPFLERVPVLRSSDFVLPLPWYQIFVFYSYTTQPSQTWEMEEVNECLLIASLEISCWKEQFKQVVSLSLTLIIFHAIQFLFIILTIQIKISLNYLNFQGFAETILTPLQASTVLFKADWRRAAQNPPLPPITQEQIMNGDLKHLEKTLINTCLLW